jgi:8-oxo-dGTP pyrophosphatase MutT (NUDIX family)
MIDPKTTLGYVAVLVLNSRFQALTLYSNTYGAMTLPGGKVEPEDQSIEHRAISELQEEVDLIGEMGAFRLLYKQSILFQQKNGSYGPEREGRLLHALRVTGTVRQTMSDRPLEWLDYTQLIARAPAFFADFYKAALPPGSGFAFLEPTKGV